MKRRRFPRLFAHQLLLALSIDLVGLLSGALIVGLTRVLGTSPWILFAYPLVLGTRGIISGMLCGRLSTAMHLGLIKPSLRRNTSYFWSLLASSFCLSILVGLLLGLVTVLLVSPNSCTPLLVVIASMGLSSLISIFLSSVVAVESFKRGLDPDVLLYPIMSSISDVLVTGIYVISITMEFNAPLSLLSIDGTLILFSVITYWRSRRRSSFSEAIKGMSAALLLLIPLEGLTGLLLSSMRVTLEAYPGAILIYPVLIDSLGDLGSILGSRVTTMLALGELKPNIGMILALKDSLLLIYMIGMAFYTLLGLVAMPLSRIRDVRQIPLFTSLLGVITIPPLMFMAVTIAFLAFRKGLNPDDFVNPLEACLSDLIMTGAMTLIAPQVLLVPKSH